MERERDNLIQPATRVYFRDVCDHSLRIIESLETYRETVSGMMDIYLSSVRYRLNEVMKVLTVFTALFAPLTFLVGVYGMNFPHIPEFGLRYAYLYLWGFMLTVTGGMFYYFKRKGWL